MTLLPPTPGLLVSMSIRHNHSFNILMKGFERYENLEEKQIALLEKMADYYASGKVFNDKQVLEEATGAGFYSSDLEDGYLSSCTTEAVKIKAIELAKMVREGK